MCLLRYFRRDVDGSAMDGDQNVCDLKSDAGGEPERHREEAYSVLNTVPGERNGSSETSTVLQCSFEKEMHLNSNMIVA